MSTDYWVSFSIILILWGLFSIPMMIGYRRLFTSPARTIFSVVRLSIVAFLSWQLFVNLAFVSVCSKYAGVTLLHDFPSQDTVVTNSWIAIFTIQAGNPELRQFELQLPVSSLPFATQDTGYAQIRRVPAVNLNEDCERFRHAVEGQRVGGTGDASGRVRRFCHELRYVDEPESDFEIVFNVRASDQDDRTVSIWPSYLLGEHRIIRRSDNITVAVFRGLASRHIQSFVPLPGNHRNNRCGNTNRTTVGRVLLGLYEHE